MHKGYHHLTYEQRCQIYALLRRGLTQTDMAKDLNLSQSTISRELERNTGKRGYRFKQAQNRACERRLNASATPRKMTAEVIKFIEKMVRERQWSPEQISGYMRIKMNTFVSHERIYQHIWRDKHNNGTLYKHLRCNGKKYNKRSKKSASRGLIPHRVSIEKRPEIVDKKSRVGDFEMDTIRGSKHRGAIASMVERRTFITFLGLLSRPTAKKTSKIIIDRLTPIKKHVHTMTNDNGKEFASHQKISKALNIDVYFANPYRAWERGLNENTNRLVRQYFPKKYDFTTLTKKQVLKVEYLLNTRPRKSLKYQTPIEVFLQLTGVKLNYALQS